MREFKRLLFAVLLLTFVGGAGFGAWIGTLTAAPRERTADVDRRLEDFREAFPDLTASQVRQLRTILYRHDHAVADIRQRISRRQWREQLEQEKASRAAIRQILNEAQRTEYDKLTGRQ